MCFECRTTRLNRRNLLKFAGLGAALALSPRLASAEEMQPAMTPAEALEKLKQGNEKFVTDANACAVRLVEKRSELAKGQAPWATILTCSDSRVTPELIFGGVSLGELFVVRNAGNILEVAGLGSIEYGAEHLHAPLVVVMGHKRCGAVSAACDVASNGTQLEGSIARMIEPIIPVALAARRETGDFVDNTVRANASHGAARIAAESTIIAGLVKAGKVRIVAAYYDLDSGRVEFMGTG